MKTFGLNVKKAVLYKDDTKKRIQEYRDSEYTDHEEWFAREFEQIFLTAPTDEMGNLLTALKEDYDAWKLTA